MVKHMALVPVSAILLIVKRPVPLFFTVTVWLGLVVYSFTVPKLRLVGELTSGAVPIPVSGMACGEPAALSVISKFAVRLPDGGWLECDDQRTARANRDACSTVVDEAEGSGIRPADHDRSNRQRRGSGIPHGDGLAGAGRAHILAPESEAGRRKCDNRRETCSRQGDGLR